METGEPRGMGYLEALTLTALVGVLMGLAPAAIPLAAAWVARALGLGAGGPVGADPLFVAAGTLAAVGSVVLVGLFRYGGGRRWAEVLALRPVRLRAALLALAAGMALQVPLTEVQNLAELLFPVPLAQKLLLQRLMDPSDPRHALSAVLALAVVVPCCEEALFRGLILQGLRRRYGAQPALLVSALLFGLAHIRLPAAVLPAALAGLVLGMVMLRTGSLLAAMLLHAAVNLVPVLLPERLLAIKGFNTVGESVSHVPLPLLLLSSLVAAAALYGMRARSPAS